MSLRGAMKVAARRLACAIGSALRAPAGAISNRARSASDDQTSEDCSPRQLVEFRSVVLARVQRPCVGDGRGRADHARTETPYHRFANGRLRVGLRPCSPCIDTLQNRSFRSQTTERRVASADLVLCPRVCGEILKDPLPDPDFAQRLNRRCTFFQSPKRAGKSRQGIPVRYR